MIARLIILILLFAGMACQSTSLFYCPKPELVKLRKAKAHRLKYVMAKRKEALANNQDYFQESAYKAKELSKIEAWDCPKPGLKHDKMVAKKAKDLQRRYAKNLKKVAKESEARTVSVYSETKK
ncbi:MAG TPA: hypothetical protein VIS49_01210 [Cyclobacteriaceae bacterium]